MEQNSSPSSFCFPGTNERILFIAVCRGNYTHLTPLFRKFEKYRSKLLSSILLNRLFYSSATKVKGKPSGVLYSVGCICRQRPINVQSEVLRDFVASKFQLKAMFMCLFVAYSIASELKSKNMCDKEDMLEYICAALVKHFYATIK